MAVKTDPGPYVAAIIGPPGLLVGGTSLRVTYHPLYMLNSALNHRKVLNKGILLYIHFNLFLALLLALIVFVSGMETATHIPVLQYLHPLVINHTHHSIHTVAV